MPPLVNPKLWPLLRLFNSCTSEFWLVQLKIDLNVINYRLMQKRPASYSLHLDYIIRNSSSRKSKHKQEKHSRHKGIKSKINQVKVG